MCGIAGLFGASKSFQHRDDAAHILRQMVDVLAHRGPDGDGTWLDDQDRCYLGHRRLSIIDVSDAGRQPMVSGDGRHVIVFNGEIYNFKELKTELEAQGVQLRGRTDTEVLLECLAVWGTDALAKLDGMYAFAVFDRDTGSLLLARDPFGEKPLCYTELSGGGFAFASELRSLELIPGIDRTIHTDAVGEYLTFQYINAPRTIYRNVKKLLPGHWLKLSPDGTALTGRHFAFDPRSSGIEKRPVPELADELEEILARSIKRRMIADVPLGAFLSGGVDSSTVCALVRKKLGSPLKTFSVGFEGYPESEHATASAIARHLQTEHHELILKPDVQNFLENAGRFMDEPNGDSSCAAVYQLSEATRKHVTVALSGDGGDEMFFGYGRYFDLANDADGTRSPYQPHRGKQYVDSVAVGSDHMLTTLFGRAPKLAASLADSMVAQIDRTAEPLTSTLRRIDVETYLPGAVLAKVDRMSMQHALEVRTPLLSIELARFCERLRPEALYRQPFGKLVLREVMRRYLPGHFVDAPKRGFGLPQATWGRTQLLAMANETLAASDSKLGHYFGRRTMDRFLSMQRSQRGFSYYELWEMVVLETWLRNRQVDLPADVRRGRLWSGFKPKPRRRERKPLYAWPIGDRAYVVSEYRTNDVFEVQRVCKAIQDNGSEIDEPETHPLSPGAARIFEMLLCKDLAARHPDEDVPDYASRPIMLPGWRSRFGKIKSEDQARLRGSILLFPDSPSTQVSKRSSVRRFFRLGVLELVIWNELEGSTITLKLDESSKRPLLPTTRLWLGRSASWFKSAARINDRSNLEIELPGRRDIPNVDGLELYEGFQRLIPVRGAGKPIRLPPGRFWLGDGACEFAPRRNRRWPPRPFWLTTRTSANRDLFAYDISFDEPLVDERNVVDQVEEIFREDKTLHGNIAADRASRPVVLVVPSLAPGGAERQWCYLAKGLKQLGVKVEFVVMGDIEGNNGHYLPLLDAIGVRPVVLGQGRTTRNIAFSRKTAIVHALARAGADCWYMKRVPDLINLLLQSKPAAVIAQLDAANISAAIAAQLAGVPKIVLSFRNYNPDNFSYLIHPHYRPLYRVMSKSPRVRLTGNAQAICRDYAKWIGIEPSGISYIPNALDSHSTKPAAPDDVRRLRQELRIPPSAPVIIGAFRLSAEKCPFDFIDVCSKIAEAVPNVSIVIVGVGPMQTEIEERIRQKGLENIVRLVGRRQDISVFLSMADLVLHTACLEGMPNILMEAQSLGKPVVATAVGGAPDVVVHGRTGFLTNVGDIDQLSAHCISLLTNSELSRAFSASTAIHIEQFKNIETMASRYLRIVDR